MNSQNEQCYQLAISSRTDTTEIVVLFTFREMIITRMSVIIFFMEDRSRLKYIYLPRRYIGGVCRECDYVIRV